MSIARDMLRKLDLIIENQRLMHQHIHGIIGGQIIMGAALDRMKNAVDANAASTDDLANEVAEAVEWIKSNPGSGGPELEELAARLEEKNEKAKQAAADLDKAVKDAAFEEHAAGM